MCYYLYKKFIKSRKTTKTAATTTTTATTTDSNNQVKTTKSCPHRSEPSTGVCPDCKSEKSAARKYRWKIILCLVWPFALQALDATIIASALPWIASDFGETSQLNWIVSAFNLTASTFIPCWAQIADVFGRNVAINGAIILMLIGSALCTGAPTDAFPVLLLGRGFQGMAAAGLSVVVRTILSDRVSLQENAKNWAIFSFVGGISYALGPVIGGYLTVADWRWCFGINLPIGAVALLITVVLLRKELLGPQPIPELDETAETGRRTKFLVRLNTIDVGGQFLFLFGFGLIILGLTWGGATYPWDSAAVLVPLVIGGVLACGFLYWERQMCPGRPLANRLSRQRAMIPWSIITNRDVGIIFFSECVSGMAMYAVLYFCNIYFIAVKGFTSDKAGVQLLYFTPGLGVGVYLCAFFCNFWPKMTFPPIFLGTTIEMVGIGLLAWAMHNGHTATIYGMMAMIGVGMGLRFMAAPLHGIGMFRNSRAALIGLMALAIPFGGTLGLTIMSTTFNNVSGLSANQDFSKQGDLSPAAKADYVDKARKGVVWAFVAIVPCLVVAWFCVTLIGNVKINQGPKDSPNENTIIKGPYLWSLLRGRQNVDEERQAGEEKQDSDGSEEKDNIHVVQQEPAKEEPMMSTPPATKE